MIVLSHESGMKYGWFRRPVIRHPEESAMMTDPGVP